jgi:two-component system, NarL family, sensor histidine kinase DesK
MNRTDSERWDGGPRNSRAARILGTLFTGIWLLYLIGPIVDLFTGHYSLPYQVSGLAILLVFSAIYVTVVPRWPFSPRYAVHSLVVMAALAVAACIVYGGLGAVALWIFMGSACGLLVVNRRWAVRAVTGCIVAYAVFSVTGHVSMADFLGDLLPVVFVGFCMIGLRRQVELTQELSRAREEVVQLAASEERLRLARDMHDLTGQSLSMITLKSELAARLLGRLPASAERDRVRDEIDQVAAVSRQTLRDIREAISGYRRPTLAVEIITARTALASAGIAARDDAKLTMLSGTFDPDAEAALAWCLREAVTNVVRHSGATNCYISLASRAAGMSLTVRDDGNGHTSSGRRGTPPSPADSMPHSSGLRGMSERLSAVGGTLEVRPDLHPGFSLTATVPAAPPAQALQTDHAAPSKPAVQAPSAEAAAREKILDR